NNANTTLEYRKELALKAFEVTKNYDSAIHNYFAGGQVMPLRYG
ncbi:MAG TPA: hypothetical protein DD396_01870, partial [Bacteroidetes bacterium]|nr:hypothetical protein [Bacteroidota bacterium]